MKRFFSLLLAGVMIFGLAGCGETKVPSESQDAADVEAPEAEDHSAALGQLPEGLTFLGENADDLAEKLLGFSADTALMTVNGQAVSAEVYLYWLGNMTAYYEYLYSMYGMSFDLATEMEDGSTYGDQMKAMAYDNCVLLSITPAVAEKLGVSLGDEDMAELAEQRASDIESAGGEEAYAQNLQAMGISDAASFELDRITALYDKVQEQYVSDALAVLSDDEVEAYAEENDILSAKHILILTKDSETGETYDEEKKAEAEAKALMILEQLKNGADFDELMQEYSEDTGLESYPDGYTFGSGEMVTEFEEGTRALAVGEMSEEPVESSYGYHIILRQSAVNDETRQSAAVGKFNEMVDAEITVAVVTTAEEYDRFTAADYYNALIAYQEELFAAEEEEDAAEEEDDGSEKLSEAIDIIKDAQ